MGCLFRAGRWAGVLAVMAALSAPAAGQSTDVFKGFSKGSNDPIQVDATALEIFEEGETRISVFSGGVTVVRGDTTMKAGTIKLYSDTKGDAEAFTRMEATGTVHVVSGDQTVTGSSAVVDNKAQTITLTGNVALSQGKNIVVGERLVVDIATGHARIDPLPGSPVRVMITPDKKKAN